MRAREAASGSALARLVAAVACGIAIFAIVPCRAGGCCVFLGATAVTLVTLERRLTRSERPELVAVAGMLVILALLRWARRSAAARTVRCCPGSSSRCDGRRSLSAAGGRGWRRDHRLGDARGHRGRGRSGAGRRSRAADRRSTLLVAVTAITSALMHGELEHRDRAVLDPLTGLLNRASLESRAVEIEQQARLSGGAVSLVLLRPRPLQARERHLRARARRRRAARRGLRDPQVAAQLRARLPDRAARSSSCCCRASARRGGRDG